MNRALHIAIIFLGAFVGGIVAQPAVGRFPRGWASGPGVFSQVLTQLGTSQFTFNSYPFQFWELSGGTVASPVATPGPLFKISKTENMDTSVCNGSNVQNECNATLAVYSAGVAGSTMQPNAIYASAKGSPTGTSLVAINAIGDVTGSSTGTGTGAYLEGQRDTITGRQVGAEVRSSNNTSTAEHYSSNSLSGGALWLSASGAAQSAHGSALKNVGQAFEVGYAALQTSVINQTFRDDSSSITSVMLNGAHTNGIDMTGGTFSGAPLLAPLSTPASSSAACTSGATEWDASFIYVCTATNTWKRATLATF